MDIMIPIALYHDEKDNEPTVTEVTWAELSAKLTAGKPSQCTAATCVGKKCLFKRNNQDGDHGAWSPVIIEERRLNDNVKAVTALVLDGDALSEEKLTTVNECMQKRKLTFIAHTTHRHRPDATFIRLVLKLSRPVLPSEWKTFYDKATRYLGFTGIFDPRVKDLSRLFFFPTHPSDVQFLSDAGEGAALDVDAVLGIMVVETAPDAPTEPCTDFATAVEHLRSYRRKRSQGDADDKDKADLIGKLLDGKPLAAPGGNAQPPPITPPADLVPGRGYAIMRAVAILTGWLPADTPDGVYLDLFRNSITAMCFGRLEDRTEMEEQVLEKLRIGRIRREEWDKEALERNKAAKTFMEAKERERAAKRVVGEVAVATDDWLTKLEFPANTKEGDDKGPKGTAHNVHLILNNAEEFKGCFRWDEVRLRVTTGSPFTNVDEETLSDEVALYLAAKWGITVDSLIVWRQILVIARRNKFDPIRDYLRSLKWDGVSRVEEWLINYANVDDSPFARKVGRKWLVGSVARGLSPGVKHDCVLVLEGQQGRRKSTLFEILGGEFYAAVSLAVADKDSKMVAGRSWISELPDLAALKKTSEINAIKAFFATRKDTFRPPFGRAVIDSPRRNSFAGTTNDDKYLADPTGNRRYLCVRCTAPIDQKLITADRDQLWAEAVVLYDKHVSECEDKTTCGCWWFHDGEAEEPELENRDRMQEEPMELLIREWWESLPTETRPREMTGAYIAKVALEYSPDRITTSVLTLIGHAMKVLGFKKKQKAKESDTGKRPWVYLATEDLVKRPQSEPSKKMKFKVVKGDAAQDNIAADPN